MTVISISIPAAMVKSIIINGGQPAKYFLYRPSATFHIAEGALGLYVLVFQFRNKLKGNLLQAVNDKMKGNDLHCKGLPLT